MFTPLKPQQEAFLKAIFNCRQVPNKLWDEYAEIIPLDPDSQWLLPLLFRNLKIHGLTNPAYKLAENVYRHTWYRNVLMLQEIKRIFRPMLSREKPIVFCKGAALLLRYYQDWGARSIESYDVMFPDVKHSESIACLEEMNWVVSFDSDTDCYVQYVDPLGRKINVHRYLCPPEINESNLTNFDTHLIRVSALTLDPIYQILHIITNTNGWDKRSSLWWAADTATVLMQNPKNFEWDRLFDQARQHKLHDVIFQGLRYVCDIFSFDLPNMGY